MGVLVEQIAASAVREHLLANLPAKVAAVNALRAPVLKAALLGDYTLPGAGKGLYISLTGGAPFTHCVLQGGVRSAAAVASDINNAIGSPYPADFDTGNRLTLSTITAPTAATQMIAVGDDQGEGINSIFGWDAGGENVTRSMLVAPSFKGVADGWPLLNDLGGGFWVIIGDREAVPVRRAASTVRADEYLVALELGVFCPVTNEQVHRDREAIQSCMRCVREVMFTDAGRYAGRAGLGDVGLVEEMKSRVPGRPWKFRGENAPNALFDVAAMQFNVRVFERPAST